jgi:branched-chain amino acid aminotransferase
MSKSINWKNLGFEYRPTNCFVMSEYRNGRWGTLKTQKDPYVRLHIGATCLHYGQACFEGLKAFSQKNGGIALFRPDANARRLGDSARRIAMIAPPVELFVKAVTMAVKKNREFVPPYGTRASLYVRPLLIGATPRIGLQPADDYLFLVMVTPAGPYYKHGFSPVNAIVQDEYDRAAPRGVGNVKVAGNYAAGLLGGLTAKKKGYAVELYLDSAERKFVDEFGTSNFFGITKTGHYVTPASTSVLPSITNLSLQQIARDLGMPVEKRRIAFSELPKFKEIGACGTAAVITPIYSIANGKKVITFGKPDQAGQTLTELFTTLQQIQYGEIKDPHGWMVRI